MNLSFRDLECFLAFAKAGHVARAAELCGTTQPTVSKALSRVERQFGIPLFHRGRRGLRLNPAGNAMVAPLQQVQAKYEIARSCSGSLRAEQEGVLRIGVTGGLRNSFLAATVSVLVRRRPALRVVLRVGLSDKLVEAVLNGSLDLAVVPAYSDVAGDASIEVIGADPLLPAARSGHPLARRRAIRVADTLKYPWVLATPGSAGRQAVEALFKAKGLPLPRIAMEVEFVSDVVLRVIESSDAVAMVPASMLGVAEDYEVHPLGIVALRIPRKLLLVSRVAQRQAPLVHDFLEIAKAQWRDQK
jgi:DNA-binding transcriptional LysR family regulator